MILNKKRAPYLFILPFLILFLLFRVWPIFRALILSLHKVHTLENMDFVGLQNYIELIQDSDFVKAILNNTYYMIGLMITCLSIPLFLSLLLDSKYCKGKNIYKTLLFIPTLTSLVIAAAIFRIIFYEGSGGILNTFLGLFNISPQGWLVDSKWAIPSLIIIGTWRWTGINIIYFTTGLKGIPQRLYETASIDGASNWQKFRYITLPQLKPIIIFVMTLTLIGAYKLFAEVYVLWAGGNSPNDSALTLAILLYRQAFNRMNLGYGATIGFVMALIILILSLIQFKLTGFFDEE